MIEKGVAVIYQELMLLPAFHCGGKHLRRADARQQIRKN